MRQYTGSYHSKETPYSQTVEIRDGQLAMRWGSDREPEGYEVWAEVAVCGDESSAAEL